MGNPQNYSLELPGRCLSLIDDLWEDVRGIEDHNKRYGGPLTTTFLVALATPAVVLPMERVQKHLGKPEEGLADDRRVSPRTAKRIDAVFGKKSPFAEAPFYNSADGWSYVFLANRFNIAHGLPKEIAQALSEDAAPTAAAALDAKEAILALRNALAHGVVGFLDKDGHSTYGEISTMLAFVGEKRKGKDFVGLHVLRISETGFRSFLRRWVNWLDESGVTKALAA